jgi:hypothetical protein
MKCDRLSMARFDSMVAWNIAPVSVWDMTNAFCYADVEGEVYIKAPKESEIPSGYHFEL